MKKDKILHFLAGYFIASVFQFAGFWCLIPVLIAGYLKELWDKRVEEEKFDLIDFACTFAGGLLSLWIEILN